MMVTSISNADDLIDSRDVIARFEELQSVGLDLDEIEERASLRRLIAEAEGYAEDWQYGATLIRDSYFKDYAMDLAEDIGAIDRDASWPNTCIDWERAARELRMDYTAIEWDGVTYWVR